MEFIKIKDTNSQKFKEAWKIYNYSFPLNEKATLFQQKEEIQKKDYSFYCVMEENVVALLCIFNLKNLLFIECLAVK